MILVDTALRQRAAEGRPVRFALFGAGFMGRGIANQVCRYTPGMELVVICNRTVDAAVQAFSLAGVDDVTLVTTAAELEDVVRRGGHAVTDDPAVVCGSESVEVVVEATGHVEYGARVTTAAIEAGKHVVLMNAELDATVGPLLKERADVAGVVVTGCDGDQPGVQLNLLRFVEQLGLTPRVAGNIKGLQDRYRNPTTQAGFAKQWGQTPHMVTSFADGTKISFEQAIVANATGMTVAQRGMIGLEHRGPVDDMVGMYDLDRLRELGGVVEYVVGGLPSPGVYVFAEATDRTQAHYLDYGKLGKGPLYSFYVPYHLTVFEVPLSVARVALFGDTVIAPAAGPVVDVVAAAKVDSRAGQVLDGLGWYMTYGLCETYDVVRRDNLLPMGLAEGCTLRRDVVKDQVLTYDDVVLPTDTLVHRLRAEQDARFAPGGTDR
ncbi:NAD(P)H-dependent oxidoreductase [Aquipuribacter sp. SD81]|uniref:NAD(P)H-dependent oxidoreductase n=1 Tax=Aquipuribacter sp. SD81 TaxID=3127703 RepID=UPI0030191B37